MYLGGNGFYWRISYHPELPGVIECRKSEDGIRAFAPRPGEFYASFTGEYTGLWRRNGRPPNELTGVGMVSQGFDISSPYIRMETSRDPRAAFIFEGVEEDVIGDFGLSGGGAAGLELDAVDLALGTPPHSSMFNVILASGDNIEIGSNMAIGDPDYCSGSGAGSVQMLAANDVIISSNTTFGGVQMIAGGIVDMASNGVSSTAMSVQAGGEIKLGSNIELGVCDDGPSDHARFVEETSSPGSLVR